VDSVKFQLATSKLGSNLAIKSVTNHMSILKSVIFQNNFTIEHRPKNFGTVSSDEKKNMGANIE
jgi:hypothetical protein